MILTDREIRIAIESRTIDIEPAPTDAAFSSTSLDLTLDEELTEFKKYPPGIETIIDPAGPGYKYETVSAAITESKHISQEDGYLLNPHILVLGWTKEHIDLKNTSRIAARVEGKSSLARLGLGIHITAPTIHAGFKGRIRLEIVNHGEIPIRLRRGMSMCQLIFEQTLGTPNRGYQGQFFGQ